MVHNHVPLDPSGIAAALLLTKTADPSGLHSPARIGDVIRYVIALRNDGPLPLRGISLDDPLTADEALTPEAGVTDDGVLDPGETWTWTASVTLDAGNVNAARIENMATLRGTDAWGAPVALESAPARRTNAEPSSGPAATWRSSSTRSGSISPVRASARPGTATRGNGASTAPRPRSGATTASESGCS